MRVSHIGSSKAISPRNEPVSGRRYILEVGSVKNDCRWRRGWNWNWRIRNGEKIPTGGTSTATSHTSLYTHEKCAEVVIGKRIPWLTYPSRRTERDMLTHIPLTYTHPGDFFLFLIFISWSAIYFFWNLYRDSTLSKENMSQKYSDIIVTIQDGIGTIKVGHLFISD